MKVFIRKSGTEVVKNKQLEIELETERISFDDKNRNGPDSREELGVREGLSHEPIMLEPMAMIAMISGRSKTV